MSIDWNEDIKSFERYPKLSMGVNSNVNIEFQDNGTLIEKELLERKGAEYPRDSYVFVVRNLKDNHKYELWVSKNNNSLLSQFKEIALSNSGSVKNLKLKLTRISRSKTEPNYKIGRI